MGDLLEPIERQAADALRGGVGCDEVGELGFKVLQFLVELVILQIGDDRLGQHVITVVVLANLVAEAGDSFLGFRFRHRGKPKGSGSQSKG